MRGVILVGGASRRMGQPKALLDLRGQALLDRVVRCLSARCDEVLLIGRGPITAAADSLVRLHDAPGAHGPLAGLLSAARLGGAFLVAPCDAAELSVEALDWLLGQRATGFDAVIPRVAGHPQPLIAVYEPGALRALERAAAEDRPARTLAEDLRVATPSPPHVLEVAWTNVNTPADLERARSPRPSARS